MAATLNEFERRTLGVLMEKELSQPEYYPMTVNALVAGCNQKHNRDPVTDYDTVVVEGALGTLQKRGLVTLILPSQGARSRRYAHRADDAFGWQKPDRALMTELLLRGPQTAGELKTRCARFVRFADLEVVQQALDDLGRRDPPVVAALPREPGRSAIRYTHLLEPADEQAPTPAVAPRGERPAPVTPGSKPDAHDLGRQLAILREEVDHLSQRVAALERQQAGSESRLKDVSP